MKIITTPTSTSLKDLLIEAWYDLKIIEENRIKTNNSSDNYGVYIENIWASSIYIENLFTADSVNWKEIQATKDFSLNISELSKLNFISWTWAINVKILIV